MWKLKVGIGTNLFGTLGMRSFFYSILILLNLSFLNHAQDDKVLAKIGPMNIYESEFRERFDFSAHPKLLQNSDTLAVKEEFLHQLIAEKLLSLEAREKGYDTSADFKSIFIPLENMFIRDALYKKEIKDKISDNQEDIKEGLNRILKVLNVEFIFSKQENEISKIYNQLISGTNFDSLLSYRKENSANPKLIKFGTMEKSVEDVVYSLEQGQYTSPVKGEDGFYIFKLISIENNPDIKNTESASEEVKKIVRTREEYQRYLDYYHNFFKDIKITADKVIFEKLSKIFISEFKSKYSEVNDNTNKFYLKGEEIYQSLNKTDSESLNKIFINIKDKPIKIKSFINQLSLDGLVVKDLNEMNIRSSLSAYIRKYIEDQLLTAEGYKEGLENNPEVKKYTGMWEDSYLSKLLMVHMFDSVSVSEEQAYSVYQQNDWKRTPPQLINIAEVLTDSLSIAEKVLNELNKGANIKDIARKYTKRDSIRDKGGEFGYFNITQHGEIGRIASQLNINDIYGPVKLDEGYSIFQILDKKDDTTSYTMSFNEVKEQLIEKLTLAKFEKYINEYNSALANKYGVEINDDALKNFDDIFMNLVVARYMGFGGEIYAVPYTEEYSGWYEIWQKGRNIAQ